MRQPSAFLKSLEQRTTGIRTDFPESEKLTATRREELYSAIGQLIGKTPLKKIDAAYGSSIWMKDESQNPGESHYDRGFHHLLKNLELDGKIIPGRSTLLEVTSGSAGISFGWLSKILGYKSQIVIPEGLPRARKRMIEETVDEVIPSGRPGEYLVGAVGKFREIISAPENKKLRRERKLALPNHSQSPYTPEGFEEIGKEVISQLPKEIQLDAAMLAMGNGTSIEGIMRPLRQKFGETLSLHGFRDAEKAGTVSLFGAGGATKLHMPFLQNLKFDDVTLMEEFDWLSTFETYNKGKRRPETIGRTTAAAMVNAQRIIHRHKRAMNILMLIYEKGDRGETVVTDDRDIYLRDGCWMA